MSKRLEKLKKTMAETGEFLYKNVVKPVGKFLQEGTDTLSVRGFRTKYKGVATEKDEQDFREAARAGNTKAMQEIRRRLDEQSKKHEGQDAVQQTDQNSRGKEELEGEGVRGREGEDSPVRGPEDAGPLRRARKKKELSSPPQVRPAGK